jgi:CheY-like chemotaxis protein
VDQMNRILVIEDDVAVAGSLTEGIGREGYDVHWEATGGGGVAYARDHGPHLIVLAVKFTPAGGRVELGAGATGGQALIWVADDGPGIPPADRARVFERFYRARPTAGAPGSGLGLAIVRATAEQCGGTARLADTVAGTRVELRLPLAPGSGAAASS